MYDIDLVGYFGDPKPRDVPRVVAGAGLRGSQILLIDCDEDAQANACDRDWGSFAEFRAAAALGEVNLLAEHVPWLAGHAFLVREEQIAAEYLPLAPIEAHLRNFVDHCREQGHKLFRQACERQARLLFDRARRVSNEVDDYVLLATTGPSKSRQPWLNWLALHAPNLPVIRRGEELGTIVHRRIFSARESELPSASSM